ncbi:MAG: NADH-quinone oxidoreductase subunit NuoE [Candidatus Lokiarchaeota archaeon]|nr:NADH-quinone oxidoreductase subunit NuoE [Candidatus Lokiarchaeota archaeon]
MEDIKGIVGKYHHDASQLISVLHDTQAKYNYLPKSALELISEEMKIPLPDIYQVATFYKAFSLKPRGKYHIRVCLGTACHVRGSQRILESVERDLGIKSGETSKDGLFSLESVNCLGCCALGPVMMVNKNYHGEISPGKINKILKKYV